MGETGRRIRTERVDRGVPVPDPVRDPDVLAGFLEDASGYGGGRAEGVLRVRGEAELAALVRATTGRRVPLLAQGARSSLTGGAVPDGGLVLAIEGLEEVKEIRREGRGGRVVAGAGIPLETLQERVREAGLDYPPIPTHREATLGGTAATNAGGPATFKHGVTRDWIERVRGVLANGDVLDVRRGQAVAAPGEAFEIRLADGATVRVPVPDAYRTPPLRKVSAGYFVAEATDLVDLLVGSEGTLLVMTEIEARLGPRPAGELAGLVFTPDEAEALRLTAELRDASRRTWAEADPRGIDVRSIELLGPNCLRLVRERGVPEALRLDLPADAGAAVLFEAELPEAVGTETALDRLTRRLEGRDLPDGPLARLFTLLAARVPLESLELAFPDDASGRRRFTRLRASVPEGINEILAERRTADPRLVKLGGDPIVPVDTLEEMLPFYHEVFERRGIEHAIWGHVSDGNLHPNAIPSTIDEARAAEDAQREIAAEARRRGGSPLSEHGVGRSRLKQALLRDFYGDAAIEQMRAVKNALDPEWRLAPGVLFARKDPSR
jgi:D-lactate dehydrogenase (cytochrome)